MIIRDVLKNINSDSVLLKSEHVFGSVFSSLEFHMRHGRFDLIPFHPSGECAARRFHVASDWGTNSELYIVPLSVGN